MIVKLIKFLKAWFYYPKFRQYLYNEGTKPTQTRLQYAKKNSND